MRRSAASDCGRRSSSRAARRPDTGSRSSSGAVVTSPPPSEPSPPGRWRSPRSSGSSCTSSRGTKAPGGRPRPLDTHERECYGPGSAWATPGRTCTCTASYRRAELLPRDGGSVLDRLHALPFQVLEVVPHVLENLRRVTLPVDDLADHPHRLSGAVRPRRVPREPLV